MLTERNHGTESSRNSTNQHTAHAATSELTQHANTNSSRTLSKSDYANNNSRTPASLICGSRSADIYEKLKQVGEGTYGKVYMARNKETGEIVALKKIIMDHEKEGFPITAIREIKILSSLRHENVVQLKEIVTGKDADGLSIYMVFEYMDHDLAGLVTSDTIRFRPTPAQIKCYMKQLLQGLYFCHSNQILHRDLKASNLLMNNRGQLKLADFGLARPYFTDRQGHYTNRVITIWYRPPELLLGSTSYGPPIDIWSAGCILAELLLGRPLCPGHNEVEQLDLIYKTCGTPHENNWPGVSKLPYWEMMKPQQVLLRRLRDEFKGTDEKAMDLIDKMLMLDPSKRITASDALDHDYFWSDPLPCEPAQLPQFPSSHEFEGKNRKQRAMQQQQHQNGPNGYRPPNNNNGYPPNDAAKRQRGMQGNYHPVYHNNPHFENQHHRDFDSRSVGYKRPYDSVGNQSGYMPDRNGGPYRPHPRDQYPPNGRGRAPEGFPPPHVNSRYYPPPRNYGGPGPNHQPPPPPPPRPQNPLPQKQLPR